MRLSFFILSLMKEYIYGIHAVAALLAHHPQSVEHLLVQAGRQDRALERCLTQAKRAGIAVQLVERKVIDKQFKQSVVHQGVMAVCHSLPVYTESDLSNIFDAVSGRKIVLILDGVQDPHNLGACLRVANAMGCCCVIAPKDKSAGLTSTAIKVSTGAAFATPFVQVSNLARAMKQCQQLGLWLVGLTAETDMAIANVDVAGDVGVVMGAEGAGLRALTMKNCDYLARIPMHGVVDSLNVSVAAGIALYQVSMVD
jgi:23S rRNA (guanosine2251-2'-O)-methyltransferase